MYKRDVPEITSWVESAGPDGITAVGAFVLCTIQTPLSRVKDQVAGVKRDGYSSEYLWGHKRAGFYHLRFYRNELYDLLLGRSQSREETLYRLLACPSLGLPKAAFLMQCVGWETACIDSHNAKRFGITVDKITPVMKPQTKEKKVLDYLSECDKLGTSEFFWDSWSNFVAGNRMNKTLTTADAVSRYHVEAITVTV